MNITSNLVGTPKQINWATAIIDGLQKKYPGASLPDYQSAEFWIRYRDASLQDIQSAEFEISSPFTQEYPRYTRNDAICTARMLKNFVVIDTETSGLRKTDEVIEIAAVHYDTGLILLNTLIKPTDISLLESGGAKDIHHIAESELLGAPIFTDVAVQIAQIVDAYHVVTFNTFFDMPAIQRMFYRYKLEIPRIKATCAMRLYSAFAGVQDFISLSEACSNLGIDRSGMGDEHRALADTLATIEIIRTVKHA